MVLPKKSYLGCSFGDLSMSMLPPSYWLGDFGKTCRGLLSGEGVYLREVDCCLCPDCENRVGKWE